MHHVRDGLGGLIAGSVKREKAKSFRGNLKHSEDEFRENDFGGASRPL